MFNKIVRNSKKWLFESSAQTLESAYQAALKIKQIEDKHFQGKKIAIQNTEYGETQFSYFKNELNSNLQIVKLKMAQFKTSRFFGNISDNGDRHHKESYSGNNLFDSTEDFFLERLKLIDQIIGKYLHEEKFDNKYLPIKEIVIKKNVDLEKKSNLKSSKKMTKEDINVTTISDKAGILPRSFLRTLSRIKQEIDPQSEQTEEQVINKFRESRYKTAISIKFLLFLIIIPLIVNNVSKITLGNFVVNSFFEQKEQVLFINNDLKEEALSELRIFEENLHFQNIIGATSELSETELEEKIKDKALELSEEYRQQSANAVKNVFADAISFVTFCLILVFNRKEIVIVKSFLDEIVYGLSDSAKAFLIILFTDIFVGFHSPHGWEIILENISRHFGLAENRQFNFLFIATFPVILDTVLKYWIFRYLNRMSPSAVATYKNMNES